MYFSENIQNKQLSILLFLKQQLETFHQTFRGILLLLLTAINSGSYQLSMSDCCHTLLMLYTIKMRGDRKWCPYFYFFTNLHTVITICNDVFNRPNFEIRKQIIRKLSFLQTEKFIFYLARSIWKKISLVQYSEKTSRHGVISKIFQILIVMTYAK